MRNDSQWGEAPSELSSHYLASHKKVCCWRRLLILSINEIEMVNDMYRIRMLNIFIWIMTWVHLGSEHNFPGKCGPNDVLTPQSAKGDPKLSPYHFCIDHCILSLHLSQKTSIKSLPLQSASSTMQAMSLDKSILVMLTKKEVKNMLFYSVLLSWTHFATILFTAWHVLVTLWLKYTTSHCFVVVGDLTEAYHYVWRPQTSNDISRHKNTWCRRLYLKGYLN